MASFWIDRFDHILSEEEYSNAPLISFIDVVKSPQLLESYLGEEEKYLEFFHLLFSEIEQSGGAEVQFSVRGEGLPSDFSNLFTDTQKELIANPDKGPLMIKKWSLLSDLLQLGLREVISLQAKLGSVSIEIRFDMAVDCHGIEEKALKELTDKTGLFILKQFYE